MTRPGTIVVAVLLLLGGAAAAVTGALEWTHALAGAVVAATLVAVYRDTATAAEDPGWRHPRGEARPGGRHEVSDLGWSMLDGRGRVRDRVVRRVRDLAAARLRRAGRDPASLDVDLGVDLRARPTLRTLVTWLDAIERLPDAPDTPDERGPRA
ncbi:hypothetical protein [Myceligenerans pegani]|uniref:Uncharacterized protein n=1 Tax=Myceligenerans pegani TaxID=2776917 RepID=A0ABR9MVM4_9MICO|nr:hypothetical protein [Myceligenerans sp. TRM 65318]MBE1874913.1 hypothetical protein [Myceligenerans sp. TRM 65318]MBE3017184.1 hypothetical protein [Myceligenerans sp. TRM 65318]